VVFFYAFSPSHNISHVLASLAHTAQPTRAARVSFTRLFSRRYTNPPSGLKKIELDVLSKSRSLPSSRFDVHATNIYSPCPSLPEISTVLRMESTPLPFSVRVKERTPLKMSR
jgi:hypothetical protein